MNIQSERLLDWVLKNLGEDDFWSIFNVEEHYSDWDIFENKYYPEGQEGGDDLTCDLCHTVIVEGWEDISEPDAVKIMQDHIYGAHAKELITRTLTRGLCQKEGD